MSKSISLYWTCQLVGWSTYIFIYTLLYYTLGLSNLPNCFATFSLDALLGVVITHIIRVTTMKIGFFEESVFIQIFFMLLITALFSFLYAFVYTYLLQKLKLVPEVEKLQFIRNAVYNLFSKSVIVTIWNLIYFAYYYIIKRRVNSPKTFHAVLSKK